MLSRPLTALLLLLAFASAAAAQFPFQHHSGSGFKTYGKITSFLLNVPLTAPPLSGLQQFPLKNFTYVLYPTATSGAEGMIPGNTVTGAPLQIPVRRGIDDHHTDLTDPFEFQVIKEDLAQFPKAPDKLGLLVYSVLYTGAHLVNCTGVVQLLEMNKGKLLLADQFSYDCRGGAGAEWNAHKRQLTIRSARYSFGDPPCCPSRYDSVVFKLDGKSIRTGDTTIGDE
ncbi:MAG: hypothetical protein ACRD1Y_06185 [Terriglobales bacterium]